MFYLEGERRKENDGQLQIQEKDGSIRLRQTENPFPFPSSLLCMHVH